MTHDLNDVELSLGFPLGIDHSVYERVHRAQRNALRREPRELLLDTVGAMLRDRNIVQFSGGVDSSLILAAAATAARRRDLAPPIAFTLRYGHEESNETAYQEMMIDHVGIEDWIIIDVDDELDLIGTDSIEGLVRLGLPPAPRLPSREWFLRQLPGGPGTTLMSGEGGDEVLGRAPYSRLHAVRWAFANKWSRRLALTEWAHATTDQVRRRGRAAAGHLPPWLTPLGAEAVSAALRHDARPRSISMRSWMRNYRAKRGMVDLLEFYSAQSARHGLEYAAPLLDIDFIAGIGASIPERDFVERPLVVGRYFADFLPVAIARRVSKARFNLAVFGDPTRRFAEEWDGTCGVPLDYVDPEILRETWKQGSDGRSGLLLQSAYLASRAQHS